MIWSIIVGGFIGFIAGAITKKGGAMGIIANIIAGLLGSSVGQALFGTWGPTLAGMALVPSILGAVIVIAVVSFFFGKKNNLNKISLGKKNNLNKRSHDHVNRRKNRPG